MAVGQDEPIKGRYGGNDIRIRASNGLIEESKLKKYDISKAGLKKIATIYWSDGEFGFQKIGITVFENSQNKEKKISDLKKDISELENKNTELKEEKNKLTLQNTEKKKLYELAKTIASQCERSGFTKYYIKLN